MSEEHESKTENEANFHTLESQAQQSVTVHVCVCTYRKVPKEGGWGKRYFQEYE